MNSDDKAFIGLLLSVVIILCGLFYALGKGWLG